MNSYIIEHTLDSLHILDPMDKHEIAKMKLVLESTMLIYDILLSLYYCLNF
jgi:hypothetical protein